MTGLALAGLMVPEAVAYAGIAGLPAGAALMAGIAGGLVYAIFGRSRFAVVAPTSSSAAILAAAVGGLAGTGGMAADAASRGMIAAALVAMVGVIFVALAAFRLGSLSGFISRPVLRGFAFGLAILIIIRQLPRLIGVAVAPGPVWQVLWELWQALPGARPASVLLGGTALVALIALRRAPQWPGALLVMLAGLALGAGLELGHYGVALVGPVSLAVPDWSLPRLGLLPHLAQLAVPIALILFAESWGTMRTLALRHGDAIDANRELLALGAANLASALMRGMPAGAGFSAGSACAAAGARSRLAAASGAMMLLGLALFAGRWIARIPEPMLAAVVIAALTHALSPEPLLRLFRLRRDHWIALAAAGGVLVLGVLNGMLAAIVLSIAALLYDLAHPSISALGRVGQSHDFVDVARHPEARTLAGVAIFRPNAPLIFANAESVLAEIGRAARTSGEPVIIISLEESHDLDATAIEALCECAEGLARDGRRVILARAHDRVREVLAMAGAGHLAEASTYSVADAASAAGGRWQDSPV